MKPAARAGRVARLAASVVLLLAAQAARAQAGPPMITNDPGTPGDGKWEINVAAIGTVGHGSWEYALPEVDANYGVGEHVQLSANFGWNHRTSDGRTESGGEPLELGVRWRFLDEEPNGIDLAVQPVWVSKGPAASVRKGLAPAHQEFVLPLQAAKSFGGLTIGAELARHFVADEDDEWQGGAWMAHDCFESFECLAEVNTTWAEGESAATIVNLGLRHELNEHLILMGSLGRQVSGEDRATVFYAGVQLLR